MDKKCSKCSEVKPLEMFSKRYKNSDIYLNHCKACCLIRNQSWNIKNKEYVKEQQRQYQQERRKDPLYKTKSNLRTLICNSFSNKRKVKRGSRLSTILGSSYEEAFIHLFNTALSTYGFYLYDEAYEIDHIIPLSTANTEEEVVKLNHYSNLQFLTPADNSKKSNKILT